MVRSIRKHKQHRQSEQPREKDLRRLQEAEQAWVAGDVPLALRLWRGVCESCADPVARQAFFRALLLTARQAMRQGRALKAGELLEEAARLEPGRAPAIEAARAIAFALGGKPARAAQRLDNAGVIEAGDDVRELTDAYASVLAAQPPRPARLSQPRPEGDSAAMAGLRRYNRLLGGEPPALLLSEILPDPEQATRNKMRALVRQAREEAAGPIATFERCALEGLDAMEQSAQALRGGPVALAGRALRNRETAMRAELRALADQIGAGLVEKLEQLIGEASRPEPVLNVPPETVHAVAVLHLLEGHPKRALGFCAVAGPSPAVLSTTALAYARLGDVKAALECVKVDGRRASGSAAGRAVLRECVGSSLLHSGWQETPDSAAVTQSLRTLLPWLLDDGAVALVEAADNLLAPLSLRQGAPTSAFTTYSMGRVTDWRALQTMIASLERGLPVMGAGWFAPLQKAFDRVMELQGGDAGAAVQLQQLLERIDRIPSQVEASQAWLVSAARKLARVTPAASSLALAELLRRHSKLAEAQSVVDSILRGEPDNFEARLLHASLENERGRPLRAEQLLRSLMQHRPQSEAVASGLLEVLEERAGDLVGGGQTEQALAILTPMLSSACPAWKVRLAIATAHLDGEQEALSHEQIEQLLRASSENWEPWLAAAAWLHVRVGRRPALDVLERFAGRFQSERAAMLEAIRLAAEIGDGPCVLRLAEAYRRCRPAHEPEFLLQAAERCFHWMADGTPEQLLDLAVAEPLSEERSLTDALRLGMFQRRRDLVRSLLTRDGHLLDASRRGFWEHLLETGQTDAPSRRMR